MEGKINNVHLKYFKDMVEGVAQDSFSAYFPRHEKYFKETLSRAKFLRLKFSPVSEIKKILDENEVPYLWSEAAVKLEEYLLTVHKDVLNEHGGLTNTHKATLLGGAVGCFIENDLEKANAILRNYLGINSKRKVFDLEKFQDAEFLGETEMDFGNKLLGKFILEVIASLPRKFDAVEDVVINAVNKLKSFEGRPQI